MDEREKLAFAGAAWIEAARGVLERLVADHGEPGRRFSLCESFSNAPPDVSANGTAAWHFAIDGTSVMVGAGQLPGADIQITADYAATLPTARLIYTPEILARRRAAGPRPGTVGDMSKSPPYLVGLHNALAAITA